MWRRCGLAWERVKRRYPAMAKASEVYHPGMERLPRITRAQRMDVLSSQATIAGMPR